jgi:hypothetical protein
MALLCRFRSAVVVVILIGGVSGCDSTTPLAPTPSPSTAPTNSAWPPTLNANAIMIAGYVRDRAWRKLIGVRIEVLDGPDAGLSTATDAMGEFRLAGEFDSSTRFRASSPQHREVISRLPARCDRCSPNWWIHFSLETVEPSADLTGNYSVTFVADPACKTLPEEFRQRSYSATLKPISPEIAGQFTVSIRGDSLLTGYDNFHIGVAGDSFAAIVGDLHGSPGVAERLGGTTVLGFEGMAQASLGSSNASIVAALDGVISYCELRGEPAARYACAPEQTAAQVLCTSTKHQLILERTASASQ